jgi:WhiB family transcriptional regulator, redox-sensing transcriptional regulator
MSLKRDPATVDDPRMGEASHQAYIALQRGDDVPDFADLLHRPKWWDSAACRGLDLAAWFPNRGDATKAAKAICASCPVREDCLEFALAAPESLAGIFAGTTPRDRRRIRAERRHAAA